MVLASWFVPIVLLYTVSKSVLLIHYRKLFINENFYRDLPKMVLVPSNIRLKKAWLLQQRPETLRVKYSLHNEKSPLVIGIRMHFVCSFYSRCDPSMDQICQKKTVTWWLMHFTLLTLMYSSTKDKLLVRVSLKDHPAMSDDLTCFRESASGL